MTKEELVELINEYLMDYVDPQYNALSVSEGLFNKLCEHMDFDFSEDEFEDDEKTFDDDDSEAQDYTLPHDDKFGALDE